LNELFARLTFRANLNLAEVVWVFPEQISYQYSMLMP